MDYQWDDEFRCICQEIVAEGRTEEEWAELEATDMFQTRKYNGGFDAGEGAYCFSVILAQAEYWFQLPLEHVQRIADGEDVAIDIRPAE